MWIGAYSYKGGTGRTVSAANIAVSLAQKGNRVGIIDADIEAPGMDQIFEVKVPSINFLDLLVSPKRYTISRTTFPIIDIKNERKLDLEGELFILPAARDDLKLRKVSVDPSLAKVFHDIMKDFTQECDLDYIFVDSRSGLAHYSVMSLFEVDYVLLFFSWGKQHLEGTKYIISRVLDRIPKLSFLIASRIPTFIKENKIKDITERKLGKELFGCIYDDKDLAWEEQLLVLEKPDSPTAMIFNQISDKIEDIA